MRRPRRGSLRDDICMPVVGVARFERFFRRTTELDVDKDDLKRYSDFVNRKLCDVFLIGQATATGGEPHVAGKSGTGSCGLVSSRSTARVSCARTRTPRPTRSTMSRTEGSTSSSMTNLLNKTV
jgi:hypothetical protein